MKAFTLLVGATSLIIAGCAAYFSVRGIGLLFAGFMIPVMIMAASLELGKLVAASFLYRRWRKIPIFMKCYLSAAVLMLIGITSLGIYGYLSDAFNKTSTRVALYESNIEQLRSKNAYLNEQITSVNNTAATVDDKANDAITNFQDIYDKFIARQDGRKTALLERLANLDKERNALEASSGGLFSSKKKKIAELKEVQSEERTSIKESLTAIDSENKAEYDSFLVKVEDLRTKTGEVDVSKDIENYYDEIQVNETEVLKFQELIGNTDIGSFKFIAKTFNMELEQVVKWFMIVIVIVFDPLAVCLVIGYNSMLTSRANSIHNDGESDESDSGDSKQPMSSIPPPTPSIQEDVDESQLTSGEGISKTITDAKASTLKTSTSDVSIDPKLGKLPKRAMHALNTLKKTKELNRSDVVQFLKDNEK